MIAPSTCTRRHIEVTQPFLPGSHTKLSDTLDQNEHVCIELEQYAYIEPLSQNIELDRAMPILGHADKLL